MGSYPHLIDVGIMGHCIHGKTGLCVKAGIVCISRSRKGEAMIKAEISLNDGELTITPSGTTDDILQDMIVFDLAIIRLVAEATGENEDELLDSVLDVISDKRDELRDLIFEGR